VDLVALRRKLPMERLLYPNIILNDQNQAHVCPLKSRGIRAPQLVLYQFILYRYTAYHDEESAKSLIHIII
jgi:hypothetical protein